MSRGQSRLFLRLEMSRLLWQAGYPGISTGRAGSTQHLYWYFGHLYIDTLDILNIGSMEAKSVWSEYSAVAGSCGPPSLEVSSPKNLLFPIWKHTWPYSVATSPGSRNAGVSVQDRNKGERFLSLPIGRASKADMGSLGICHVSQ